MLEAARIAHAAGRTVAFTLSESLCIAGRREGVMGMINSGVVDVLFGNEHEVRHLTGCTSLSDCIDALATKIPTLVITRGAEGAIAVANGDRAEVRAAPVDKVVDTTGAGDLFAAGFIAGRCRGRDLRGCLETGSIAAAEVIFISGRVLKAISRNWSRYEQREAPCRLLWLRARGAARLC